MIFRFFLFFARLFNTRASLRDEKTQFFVITSSSLSRLLSHQPFSWLQLEAVADCLYSASFPLTRFEFYRKIMCTFFLLVMLCDRFGYAFSALNTSYIIIIAESRTAQKRANMIVCALQS